jgi:hypothetical protein
MPPPAPPALARAPVVALWLAAVAWLSLWPCLLGGYLADDVRLVERNPAVQTGDLRELLMAPMFGVEQGYWRPLTMLTLYGGSRLGGPFGAHLLSLLLHVANACAVHALARRLLPPLPALWVAVLFVVHPVQVESVGWCSAVNDPLWVAGALQAMLAATRWRDAGARGLPWLVGACTLAALLAKETGVAAVPLVLAALAWLPGGAPAPAAPGLWLRAAVALALPVLLWLVGRAVVLDEVFGRVLLGAGVAPVAAWTDLWRLPQLLVLQLGLLVWPVPVLPVRSVTPWPPAVALAAAVLGGLLLAGLWRGRRRLPPRVRFALALVLLPVLPTLAYQRVIGVWPIADRYLYLAVTGLGLLLAGVAPLWRRPWLPWLLPLLCAPYSFAATWLWYDMERFTSHAERHAPDDPMVLVMAADHRLGQAFDGDGWARVEAERRYRRALAALGPDPVGVQPRSSLAAAQLGLAWCQLLRREVGAEAEAAVIAAFRQAIDTAPHNARAWVGLGIAHGELRQFDAAAAAFREALRLDPHSVDAQRGLARLQDVRGTQSR